MKARIQDLGKIIGRSRLVLLAGFGGLLALLLILGVDAIAAVSTMQVTNASIQAEYISRSTALTRLRSDLYLAGTYVRDYITDPAPSRAEQAAGDVIRIRERMRVAAQQYDSTDRDPLVARLREDIGNYWVVTDPVLNWTPEERRQYGFAFLREEVFPRRTALLQLTEEIAAANVNRLANGNARVVTLFQAFRKRLIVLLCICSAVGLLLAGFASWKILRLESDAASRYDQMAAARSELSELSARLVHSQESERRAISRELHDEVGQSLSAVLVGLSNLTATMPAQVKLEMNAQVTRLRELAESSLSAIRNMCLLLRPSMLDDLGLLPALQWHAREITRTRGILVNIASDEIDDGALTDEHKTCIYRITQEALNNACRHASPQTIRVTVRQQQSAVSVTVQDDGCGFVPSRDRGLGIVGMQERATRLGGTFNVASQQNRGTVVALTLPIMNTCTVGA